MLLTSTHNILTFSLSSLDTLHLLSTMNIYEFRTPAQNASQPVLGDWQSGRFWGFRGKQEDEPTIPSKICVQQLSPSWGFRINKHPGALISSPGPPPPLVSSLSPPLSPSLLSFHDTSPHPSLPSSLCPIVHNKAIRLCYEYGHRSMILLTTHWSKLPVLSLWSYTDTKHN